MAIEQLTDVATIDPGLDDAALAMLLVQRAGALAAQMRAGGLEGRRKTSVSDVVTAADHAAEAFVVDALRTLRPDDGIVGEEGADQESRSGRTWVIDPVDGTYNFLSGLTYWCSAVALTDADGVALGAVHHVAPGETWCGGRDLPTQLNGIPVQPIADLPLSELSLATYVHPTRMVQASVVDPFLSMTRGAATVRMLGSGSVDLASVAGGRLGAWVQMLCPDWDWLPGKALVEAAGGATQVLEHRGHRWHLAGGPTAVRDLVKALNLS